MTAGLTQIGTLVAQDGYVAGGVVFATLAFEDIEIAASDEVIVNLTAHYAVKEYPDDGTNGVAGRYTALVLYNSGIPTIISSTIRDEEGSLNSGSVFMDVSDDDITLEIGPDGANYYECFAAFEVYAVSYDIL